MVVLGRLSRACGGVVALVLVSPAAAAGTAVLALVGSGGGGDAKGQYEPLLAAVRAKASAAGLSLLTVAAGSFDEAAPEVAALRAAHPDASVFYAGHGMAGGGGAAAAQAYAAQDPKAAGVVLLAGFLERTWRPSVAACKAKWAVQPTHKCPSGKGLPFCPGGYLEEGVHACDGPAVPAPSYPLPSLTVGGDLDGVVRVGRLAEAWYTQKDLPQHPVVVVQGMNHGDLLASPTSDVSAKDLASELGAEAARDQVASLVAGFLAAPGNFKPASQQAFFAPFVNMFVDQEGSWFWTSNSDESGSSPWAAEAQRRMAEPMPAGFQAWQTRNEFHLLSDEETIPPYYRSKHRPDVTLAADGKTVVGRTVAQLRYIQLSVTDVGVGLNGYAIIKEEKAGVLSNDKVVDDGAGYVSAIEIATKIASRQLAYNRTGTDAPESLDDGDRCKAINQAAYDLALSVASPAAKSRFQAKGRPLVMVKDVKPTPPAGPWFIWNYLQYNDKGAAGVEVSSWYAFYSLSAPAYGAGNHYCKLLSPARALEWIYTDGLRAIKAEEVRMDGEQLLV